MARLNTLLVLVGLVAACSAYTLKRGGRGPPAGEIPCPKPAGEFPTAEEIDACMSICAEPENEENKFCEKLAELEEKQDKRRGPKPPKGQKGGPRPEDIPCPEPAGDFPTEEEVIACMSICDEAENAENEFCLKLAEGKEQKDDIPCPKPAGEFPTVEEIDACMSICAEPENEENKFCEKLAELEEKQDKRRGPKPPKGQKGGPRPEDIPCPKPAGDFPTEEEVIACMSICDEAENAENEFCLKLAEGKEQKDDIPCPKPAGEFPTADEIDACISICAEPENEENKFCEKLAELEEKQDKRRGPKPPKGQKGGPRPEDIPCAAPAGEKPTEEEKLACKSICEQAENADNKFCGMLAKLQGQKDGPRPEDIPCDPPAGDEPTEEEKLTCKSICELAENAENEFCLKMAEQEEKQDKRRGPKPPKGQKGGPRPEDIPCPAPAGDEPTEEEKLACKSICEQAENAENKFCGMLAKLQGEKDGPRPEDIPCDPPAGDEPTEEEKLACKSMCELAENAENEFCLKMAEKESQEKRIEKLLLRALIDLKEKQ